MISPRADQELMLQVQIENIGTPLMIDSVATYTYVNPNYASSPHI
jgi:hypothetical protein